MVVQEFMERMQKLEVLTHVGMGDSADWLNFLVSVWLLILMSSITTAKTYFLTPIICYVPNIVGSHEGQAAYITNFCYSEGTYNVPLAEFKIDNANADWRSAYSDRKIYYYQWLPLVIGLQGVLCFLPKMAWLLFISSHVGVDLESLVKLTNEAQRAEADRREKQLRHVCRQLDMWLSGRLDRSSLRRRRGTADNCWGRFGRLYARHRCVGVLLVFVYFIIKLLYIANSLGQLVMMTRLLQLSEIEMNANRSLVSVASSFGVQLLRDLLQGKDWQNNQAFPRSGCCAVETRQASQSNFIFAQCALPVNLLHEKIFILLWFWFVFLSAANCLSLLLWLKRMCLPNQMRWLITKLLLLGSSRDYDKSDKSFKCEVDQVWWYLQPQGRFFLKMLCLNCGEVVSTEVCRILRDIAMQKENLPPKKPAGNGKVPNKTPKTNLETQSKQQGSSLSLSKRGGKKRLQYAPNHPEVQEEDYPENPDEGQKQSEGLIQPSAPPEESV